LLNPRTEGEEDAPKTQAPREGQNTHNSFSLGGSFCPLAQLHWPLLVLPYLGRLALLLVLLFQRVHTM